MGMFNGQKTTAEWTAEKCLGKLVQSKQTPKHKLINRASNK